MKTTEIFIKGIIFGLGLSLALGVSFITYAARVNLSHKNTGDTINADTWNSLLDNVDYLSGSLQSLNNGFSNSNGSSGYQKLPNGLILQRGIVAKPTASAVTLNFPMSFPNNVLFAQGSICGGSNPNGGPVSTGSPVTNGSITAYSTTYGAGYSVCYIAIGN